MVFSKSLDNKPISNRRQVQLDHLIKLSIGEDPEEILLPITTSMMNEKKSKEYTYETGNILSPIATAVVRENYPYDLAFAMTVHKSQGRTLDRLVIDLSCRPNHYTQMEFAGIFVAMSRVRRRSDIRRLSHRIPGYQHDPATAYDYLTRLKPSSFVTSFYAGYGDMDNNTDGSCWSPQLALAH